MQAFFADSCALEVAASLESLVGTQIYDEIQHCRTFSQATSYLAVVRDGMAGLFPTADPPSRALLSSFRLLSLQLRVNSTVCPAAFISRMRRFADVRRRLKVVAFMGGSVVQPSGGIKVIP